MSTMVRSRSGLYIPRSQTYAQAVMADSPEAYYRMGEASGSVMVDSSGHGRDCAYTSSPTLGVTGLVTGDSNTAVTFNGTSQYGLLAHASWMEFASAMTLELIFNASGGATLFRELICLTNSARIRLSNGGASAKAQFLLVTGAGAGTLSTLTGGTNTPISTKFHVAAVYDGANMTLYLNGTSDGSIAKTGAFNIQTGQGLTTARLASSLTELYPGTIDEIALYSTALSAARIAIHAALV